MIVFPNAKINIGLRVVAKRTDGFHNIESVFYPIMDLFDVLEIIESEELKFTASGIEIPGDLESNLCIKAYNLLKEDYKLPSVHIHLHKVIPIGAGLGGGSADAAFTLVALNNMFRLNLCIDKLISYAQKLGSDCAFFIENKPVYAFNKGDEFTHVEVDLTPYQIKIEYPNIHVGTAEAYAGIEVMKSEADLRELIQSPLIEWKSTVKNDFENSVIPLHPEIGELKRKMYYDGAIFASMTGSGSAVYGIFEKNKK